jgi:nitroreductase
MSIMSCVDKILSRRSIRRYKKDSVPSDVRNKILEAGRQAPSADNRQPWHFVVCDEKEVLKKLSGGQWNGFIKDSSFAVVGVSLPFDDTSREWGVIDTTIALQNMVLAAEVQGIGSCWIGDFVEDGVKGLLGIPSQAKVVAIIPFGLPDERPGPKSKRLMNEILHVNKW